MTEKLYENDSYLQTFTATVLACAPAPGGYTVVLIDDGRVLEQNLRYMGRDRRWLDRELARRGARGAEDVYLLALDESGKVYYAAMEAKSQ